MARQPDPRITLAVARVIPVVLFGVIIYACYAVTKPLCSEFVFVVSAEHTLLTPDSRLFDSSAPEV